MERPAPAVVARHRTHVARIYPTPAQAVVLDRQGRTARALWNLLHEWYICRNGGIARRPSVAEIDRQLRAARTDPLPGWEWLAELPAQATQQVLKNYLRAWNRFYAGSANPPKSKKGNGRLAVDVPQASQLRVTRLGRRWGEVTIPSAGRIRFRWTRPLPSVSRECPGRITGGRLTKDPLGWRLCFRIEEEAIEVPASTSPPVGVDRGVAHTLALSDGRNLDMPPLLRPREQRRLRKLELQAARRRAVRRPGVPASNRERRTYDQIAALRNRQVRRRNDWLHKQTTDLAGQHGLIVVENLQIKNMTRSARGTVKKPGINVRAKSGLNRSILGMAWSKAERMLAYKCHWQSGVLIRVGAEYSSKTCAKCGEVANESRRSRDWFCCVACDHRAPADTNAAQVLLARGLAAHSGIAPGYGVAGRGALAGMQAMKRQSPAATMTHTLLSGKILAAQAQEECQKPVTMTSSSPSHFAEFPIQVEASTSSFAMVPTRSAADSPRLAMGTWPPAVASPIPGMLP
jgi:putative transposase